MGTKFGLTLALAIGVFGAVSCLAADTINDDRRWTPDALEISIRRNLLPGMTRGSSEVFLKSLSMEFTYVPREQFDMSSPTKIIDPPPPDCVGALVASRTLKKIDGTNVTIFVAVYIGPTGLVQVTATQSILPDT